MHVCHYAPPGIETKLLISAVQSANQKSDRDPRSPCVKLSEFLPDMSGVKEYREAFLGGGSFAIHITKQYPHLKITVNDKFVQLPALLAPCCCCLPLPCHVVPACAVCCTCLAPALLPCVCLCLCLPCPPYPCPGVPGPLHAAPCCPALLSCWISCATIIIIHGSTFRPPPPPPPP